MNTFDMITYEMEVSIIAILYFLIGLFASIFGALAGLGGGIIIKPVLDLLGHFDVTTISVLSAATVFSMSIITLLSSIKMDLKINIRSSLYIAVGSVIGGFIGKFIFIFIVNQIKFSELVTIIQATFIFILLSFIYVLVKQRGKLKSYQLQNPIIIIAIGFILGVIAAFLGIGGGPFNVAILAIFFSMGVRESALNSVFIIFFSQLSSLLFTTFTTGFGNVDISIITLMVIGGMMGGFIGSRLSGVVSDQLVEKVFNIGIVTILLINMVNILTFFM